MALVFTGHEFADGGTTILQTLKQQNVKASFFFTGGFYRNKNFQSLIQQLKKEGHYLGAHSDKHLLYADWNKRDSLLISKQQFKKDLLQNYTEMKRFGINKTNATFFLPPYEWYNDSIAAWTKEMGLQLINYSPGTRSAADYTWPELPNYQNSETIYQSIFNHEQSKPAGLNGFLLLLHIGTDPRRTDKFYTRLSSLINTLKQKGYQLKRVDELFK
ncbi:polysaccharide deacetylase family protein [Lacibacter sediminis]|uniref:polysaccharide deacetylase family protein n=1 Tax=Lacibacter sediminis TaxID=2760713 RepID=UPI001C7233DA|nr:polysaccharide deacetylase family protein [Lacibacter sediminis]